MKKTRRNIKLYLATAVLCFMLVFFIKVNTSAFSTDVSVSSDKRTVTVSLPPNGSGLQYEVALLNSSGKQIATVTAYQYATFEKKTKKHKVYYYKYRLIDSYGNPASSWSKKVALNTIGVNKYKVKYKNRTVKIKVPKIKGVQCYKVYMKPYYGSSKYRKVKTIKPGKTVSISRYRGKKFKYNTYYSLKIHPIVKKKKAQGVYIIGTFRFTKVYKIRYIRRYYRRIIYI